MRPPRFWFNPPDKPGFTARLLAPQSWVYAAATAHRVGKAGMKTTVPVVSVGNINVGGTGKTPTVIALAELLSERNVHVVSRGYGGKALGPLVVDPRVAKVEDVGDEPLLLAAFTKTWVAKDRANGVNAAVNAGAGLILMDDAHQNPDVVKDASIVVVDAVQGFGNGRVMPSGPLRESVAKGLARADIVLLIGDVEARADFLKVWEAAINIPIIPAEIAPLETGMDWDGLKVLAFAGIGRPDKFFATLSGLGAKILRKVPLDDHQALSTQLLTRLDAEARLLGAQLVTTEKDAARLPEAFRGKVLTLPVRLKVDDWTPLTNILKNIK